MERKHVFTYKKLVVPTAMRSKYWKYFGFPASETNHILTKVKVVCTLCKCQIAYNKNTTNLRMHLNNKHASELEELESEVHPAEQQCKRNVEKTAVLKKTAGGNNYSYSSNVDGTVHLNPGIQLISSPPSPPAPLTFPQINTASNIRIILKGEVDNNSCSSGINIPANSNEVSNLNDNFVEFLIQDLEWPDMLDGRGFQIMLATHNSQLLYNTRAKIQDEIIPKMYENCKELLQNVTSTIQSPLALTLEEWRHFNGELFITASVNYVNGNSLESRVLRTIHGSRGLNVAQWTHFLELFLIEFDINLEKVTAVVVATTEHPLLQALHDKGLVLIPCLMHTLQVCVNACFNYPEIEYILNKCRATIGLISNYSVAKEALRIQEQLYEIEEVSLMLDTPSVWMSTYIMLEQLYERRPFISTVLENIEGLERDLFVLTEAQWTIIYELLTVLRPLKVTILTLSEEKSPLISLLKPLNLRLNQSHLKVEKNDSSIVKVLKEILSDHLNERYQDPFVNDILKLSTLLDPRFKLHWSEENRTVLHESLKRILVEFLKEDRTSTSTSTTHAAECPSDDCVTNVHPHQRKKMKFSGMEFFFGDLCPPQASLADEEKANLEIAQYESHPNSTLEECPLECWQRLEAKCPSLARLASKYLCIPPCATPSQRIPHETQIAFNIKRSKLPSNLIDKLLFLHHNYQTVS